MAFYWTCPLCGANLDRNEKCDCQDKKEQEERNIRQKLVAGKDGQLRMLFSQGGGWSCTKDFGLALPVLLQELYPLLWHHMCAGARSLA